MRDFTADEASAYDRALNWIYKSTTQLTNILRGDSTLVKKIDNRGRQWIVTDYAAVAYDKILSLVIANDGPTNAFNKPKTVHVIATLEGSKLNTVTLATDLTIDQARDLINEIIS